MRGPHMRHSVRVRFVAAFLAPALLAGAQLAMAQDARFVLPVMEIDQRLTEQEFTIEKAAISRPKVAHDITLKAHVKFPDGFGLRIKIRRAEPGGSKFNNEPRYELAAYLLQKTYLDPKDYVVPPTALRFLPLDTIIPYAPEAKPTFSASKQHTLCVVQYWLNSVSAPPDAFDPERFQRNPEYARHMANVNLLTYLIDHKDANRGNVLVAAIPESDGQLDESDPRAFLVDSGVAFDSEESTRGVYWRDLRVPRIPKASVERLAALTQDDLAALLGTVAQWEVRDGVPVAVPPEKPRSSVGVRVSGNRIQLGLTRREIGGVYRRLVLLRKRVASGDLETF